MKRSLHWTLPLAAGVIILGAWWLITIIWAEQLIYFPNPLAVVKAVWTERAELLPATGKTFWMALAGFTSAVAGGAILSLALASAKPIRLSLYPWVLALQMVPVVIMIPIFQIWFSYDAVKTIICMTFMISFFPIVANTTMGLVSTDRRLRELFSSWHARHWQEFLHLRIPFALPYFLTGVRIAAVLAPVGVITGDMLAGTSEGTSGLGFLLYKYRSEFRPDAVFAVALLSALLGFLFAAAIHWVSWLLLHRWHDSATRAE
ncbi:MAG: ABC transporter permease [Puniceicoccales bacterium]